MAREYRYFIAKGRSLEICQEAIRLRDEANVELSALYAEVGAKNARVGARIAGFGFETKPPIGWVNSMKQDRRMFLPGKRDKSLKAIRERIAAVYFPDGHWLVGKFGCGETWTSEVGTSYNGLTGNVILYPSFESLGGQIIIHMPINHKGEFGTPPDAELIKNSIYWQMIEQQQEAAVGL